MAGPADQSVKVKSTDIIEALIADYKLDGDQLVFRTPVINTFTKPQHKVAREFFENCSL